jgi:hypothetical protein
MYNSEFVRRTRDKVYLFSGNFNLLGNENILFIKTLFSSKKTINIYSSFIQINAAFQLFTGHVSFDRNLNCLVLNSSVSIIDRVPGVFVFFATSRMAVP